MNMSGHPTNSEDEIVALESASAAANAESVRRRSAASERRAAARARSWRNVRLSIAAGLCVLSAIAGTFVGNIYHNSKDGKDMLGKLAIGIMHNPLRPLSEYDIDKQLPQEKLGVVNILLLGCDVDYEPGRPVELKRSRGRSDSIMIARMDIVNKTVRVLSIPRDTAVHIPGHGITKINAANAYAGPELLAETIKETFGIDTDFYVAINFDTFKDIVDKVGGVDVTVEKDLDYDDDWGNLHIHLKKGFQHMNGYQAMGFVRMRHSDDDLHRAARQHAFMEAIRQQVKSPTILGKVPDLINTVFGQVTTNLTPSQLISLALWVKSVPKENTIMDTMPSFEGHSYVTVNVPKAEELISRMFFDNRVPVTINAPGASVVDNLGGRGRRRKGKDATGANKVQKTADNGSDDPLEPIMDDPTVSPGEISAPPAGKPDGGATTPPDAGTKTPEPQKKTGDGIDPATGTDNKKGDQKQPAGN